MKRSDVPLPLPCNESWDTMTAEGRARFCRSCRAHVHDLSGRTEEDARNFLASRAGVPTCVRYLADENDTILFSSAPSGFVPVTKVVRTRRVAALGAALVGLASLAACRAEPVMGIVGPDIPRMQVVEEPTTLVDASAAAPSDASRTDVERR